MSGTSPATPPWKAAASLHLERLRRNHRLYTRLADEGEYLDWAVAVLFYTALHLVQACLIGLATDAAQVPRNHSDRRYSVSTRLNPIFHDYRFLEDISTDMRYYPDSTPPTIEELRRYEREQFGRIATELRNHGVSLEP
jgi:hypothetical protein